MGMDSPDEVPIIEAGEIPFPLLAPREANDTPGLPVALECLAGSARGYVQAANSANTRQAYASDWKHFASWCRRQGLEIFPPDPQVVMALGLSPPDGPRFDASSTRIRVH